MATPFPAAKIIVTALVRKCFTGVYANQVKDVV